MLFLIDFPPEKNLFIEHKLLNIVDFQARNQKIGEKPLLSFSTFIQSARNNMLLAVPALLYAINNYLKFIMQVFFYMFEIILINSFISR